MVMIRSDPVIQSLRKSCAILYCFPSTCLDICASMSVLKINLVLPIHPSPCSLTALCLCLHTQLRRHASLMPALAISATTIATQPILLTPQDDYPLPLHNALELQILHMHLLIAINCLCFWPRPTHSLLSLLCLRSWPRQTSIL